MQNRMEKRLTARLGEGEVNSYYGWYCALCMLTILIAVISFPPADCFCSYSDRQRGEAYVIDSSQCILKIGHTEW